MAELCVINVKNYGATGNGVSDDTAAIQRAIDAAAAAHCQLLFPHGVYLYSATLYCDSTSNLRLQGISDRLQPSGVELRYTGAGGGNAISAQKSSAFGVSDLTLTANNIGFTGTLVNLNGTRSSPSFFATFGNVGLFGPGATSLLLSIANSYNMAFNNCVFSGCDTAVRGISSPGDFANGVTFANCSVVEGGATTHWYHNPGSAWSFIGCVFEPLASGAADGITCDSGVIAIGIEISGCWFGDATAGGAWVSFQGSGANIHGNVFSAKSTGTAIILTFPEGVSIIGNVFQSVTTAVEFVTAGQAIQYYANTYYPNTVVPYSGLPGYGLIQVNGNLTSFNAGVGTQLFTPFRARMYQTVPQSVANVTFVEVNLDTIQYDPNGNCASSQYTAPVCGYYQVNGFVEFANLTGSVQAAIYVNGSKASVGSIAGNSGGVCGSMVSDLIYLNAGDVLVLYTYQNSGSASNTFIANMSVHYLSS